MLFCSFKLQGQYRGEGAKLMAANQRAEQEAATVAATAHYMDPRQSTHPSELRAQLEMRTGESRSIDIDIQTSPAITSIPP